MTFVYISRWDKKWCLGRALFYIVWISVSQKNSTNHVYLLPHHPVNTIGFVNIVMSIWTGHSLSFILQRSVNLLDTEPDKSFCINSQFPDSWGLRQTHNISLTLGFSVWFNISKSSKLFPAYVKKTNFSVVSDHKTKQETEILQSMNPKKSFKF